MCSFQWEERNEQLALFCCQCLIQTPLWDQQAPVEHPHPHFSGHPGHVKGENQATLSGHAHGYSRTTVAYSANLQSICAIETVTPVSQFHYCGYKRNFKPSVPSVEYNTQKHSLPWLRTGVWGVPLYSPRARNPSPGCLVFCPLLRLSCLPSDKAHN